MSDTVLQNFDSDEQLNNEAYHQIRLDNDRFFKNNQSGHIFVKVSLNMTDELVHLKSLKALNRADYNETLQMWEIDDAELVLNPQLKELNKLSYAEGLKLLKTQLELKELQNEQTSLGEQRVYLDFLPAEYSQWATENKVRFDKNLGKPYLEGKYAFREENLLFISQCRNNSDLKANQIESSEITEGKKLLAEAMSKDNYVEKAELLVKAINVCAKEAAQQLPGSIKNFDNVILNFNRHGKSLNYRESYKLALSYHKAVEIMKRNHLIDDKKLKETEQLAYKQSFMTINRQAGENLKRSFSRRLSFVLNDKNLSEKEKTAAAFVIFTDYFHGHVMTYGTQLFDGRIFRKSIGFEEQQFAEQLETIISRAALQGMEQINLPKKLRAMNKLLSIETIRFENDVKEFFAYNDKRNMSSDVFSAKATDIYNQGLSAEETLKEQFKLRGLKPVEAKVLKDLQDRIKILPSTFEPLYVVLNHEQRKELDLQHKSKLMADPFSGALCVQDNPENRNYFARYFPSDEEFTKIKNEFDEKVQKCKKILKDSNIIVPDSENLFDGQTPEKPTIFGIVCPLNFGTDSPSNFGKVSPLNFGTGLLNNSPVCSVLN